MDSRLGRLLEATRSADLDAVAVIAGPNLQYLTGLSFHLMERPAVLLIRDGLTPILVLPEFERSKADRAAIPLDTVPYPEDPEKWPQAFGEAAGRLRLSGATVGVEPLRMRVLELRYLEAAAPDARYVAAGGVFETLRVRKEPDEIEAMRRAVAIAERALEQTLSKVRVGMTERDVAAELTLQLLRGGSETELPFHPIIASGPNSAKPHWATGDRRLEVGDLLIVDWGATADGYVSDITRTFAVGEAGEEALRIHAIVAEANAAGRAAVQPGVPCAAVDAAARGVIATAGFGEQFLHRTGHGIGMEAHEAPYLRDGNPMRLEAEMTFTVEPGIYLPGRGGVRIEDNVVVTSTGQETLTSLPRELRVIGS